MRLKIALWLLRTAGFTVSFEVRRKKLDGKRAGIGSLLLETGNLKKAREKHSNARVAENDSVELNGIIRISERRNLNKETV